MYIEPEGGAGTMDELRISNLPDLEHAILIGAFVGWNDAASAASWAVKFLVNHWDATECARVESDTFYDFTETRPKIRIAGGTMRQFTWPATRIYVHQAPRDEGRPLGRDVLLLLGEEPQLRWKAFSEVVLDLCRRGHVEDTVWLGALVAEVPHTLPVRINGVASTAQQVRQMREQGITPADYEGPTGILAALHDAFRKQHLATTSLWGTTPHYVSATPNLPVAEALLRRLEGLYHLDLRLSELGRAAQRFNQRVSTLVNQDKDVAAYVHDLEQRLGGTEVNAPWLSGQFPRPGAEGRRGGAQVDLPTPEEAIEDVEALLRSFREQGGTE